MTTAGPLYERAEAAAAVRRAMGSSASGRVVVLEGEPGIGKSAVLAQVLPRDSGRLLLTARGFEPEASFPFGVVRQLLEARLQQLPHAFDGAASLARAAFGGDVPTDDHAAVYHGLYWLTASLAGERPLTLVVDDAQWVDEASAAFLAYLARRVDDVSVCLVLATWPLGAASPEDLRSIVVSPRTERIVLNALSSDGVATLLRERLAPDNATAIAPSFAEACTSATGGNPFLLHALVDEIIERRLPLTEATASGIGSLALSGASRAIRARVARLGNVARRIIEVIATIGDGCRLDDLAAITGQPPMAVADACVDLQQRGLARSDGATASCAHQIVRVTVRAEIADLVVTAYRRAAADGLRRNGRSADEVAAQLVHLLDLHNQDIETLDRAADVARRRGAPAVAARYLSRILEAHPDGASRARLLARLGQAEVAAGMPAAEAHLAEAAALLTADDERRAVLVQLARVRRFGRGARDAVRILEAERASLARLDQPIDEHLEHELIAIAYSSVSARAVVRRRPFDVSSADLGNPSPGVAFLAAATGFDLALDGQRHDHAAALAAATDRLAELPRDPLSPPGFGVLMAANTLMWCDRFAVADRLHGHLVNACRDAGSVIGLCSALGLRALVRWRCGKLADGEADAAESLALASSLAAPPPLLAAALAAAVLIGLDRSHASALDELERLLATDLDTDGTPYGLALYARGRLLIARGELDRGVSMLTAAGDFDARWGAVNPAVMAWRSDAARALTLRGDPRRAADLVDEEVRRARAFGAPRAIGVALAGAATVASGEERIRLLREALDALMPSGAELEVARTFIELGVALQSAGRKDEALDLLRRGLDRASALGAFALAATATAALRASGARPRRAAISGLQSLTPGELRVARLAAAGATNRGIAQQLFVSEKTVETHLSNVYAKLDVRQRRQLAAAIAT